MLAPHELKNKVFDKVMRGYNPQEVDEYIEFIIDQYKELYKRNAELLKNYNTLSEQYSELQHNEDSVRAIILKAQKLGENIVAQARGESERISGQVQGNCDKIIEEAKKKIEAEAEILRRMREKSLAFREELFNYYAEHIKDIKSLDIGDPETSAEDLPGGEDLENNAFNGVDKNGVMAAVDEVDIPIEEVQLSMNVDDE